LAEASGKKNLIKVGEWLFSGGFHREKSVKKWKGGEKGDVRRKKFGPRTYAIRHEGDRESERSNEEKSACEKLRKRSTRGGGEVITAGDVGREQGGRKKARIVDRGKWCSRRRKKREKLLGQKRRAKKNPEKKLLRTFETIFQAGGGGNCG